MELVLVLLSLSQDSNDPGNEVIQDSWVPPSVTPRPPGHSSYLHGQSQAAGKSGTVASTKRDRGKELEAAHFQMALRRTWSHGHT